MFSSEHLKNNVEHYLVDFKVKSLGAGGEGDGGWGENQAVSEGAVRVQLQSRPMGFYTPMTPGSQTYAGNM